MRLLLAVCFLLPCITSAWTPEELAIKVSDQLLANPGAFLSWNYGGALVFDGIFSVSQVFNLSNYTKSLDTYLDNFLTDPEQDGYKIIHGQHIDFGAAVGDTVGLFPIAYLNRVKSQSGQPGYDNTTDLLVLKVVAQQYILGWPRTLVDGTFSRDKGWKGEVGQGNSFLWADDQHMGVALLARLGAHLQDPLLVLDAARQIIQFGGRMRDWDTQNSLYYHGYNEADGHKSCCKWGRGNAWGVMGNVEVLVAFQAFPYLLHSPMHEEVLQMFQMRMEALLDWQSSDGRWHQVINETSTYLETSCTAMFLIGMIRGVKEGWLEEGSFHQPIMNAWAGLQKTVSTNGTVSGVCMGTGIQDKLEDYATRPTPYLLSGPGVGAVATAAALVQQYIQEGQRLITL